MRNLLFSALLSALSTSGFAAPLSVSSHDISAAVCLPQIMWVHHERSDNAPPAQMLTALPADDWPVTNWYKQSVYDLSSTKLGEIADILNHEGKNTAVVIGVGGRDTAL